MQRYYPCGPLNEYNSGKLLKGMGWDAVLTADPRTDMKVIRECCRKQGIPLYETEGANHSLETGDVEKDIKELRKVIRAVREFIGG